jgi:hypothetical protein
VTSPALVEQEIWGYLLTAWAIAALIADAASAAWIDPGRVSFTKAVRVTRRAAGPAFPSQRADEILAAAKVKLAGSEMVTLDGQ